jgi:hypothetical protein
MVQSLRHKHHIVPRYEGGSDDPSNLVELTSTQHAMWHFAEWQRKNNKEDFIAWKALAAIIPEEERFLLLSQLGGSRSKGKKWTEENRAKLRKPKPGAHGYKWWYHPEIEEVVKSRECPGEGWVNGRGNRFKEVSSERRKDYWRRVKS